MDDYGEVMRIQALRECSEVFSSRSLGMEPTIRAALEVAFAQETRP